MPNYGFPNYLLKKNEIRKNEKNYVRKKGMYEESEMTTTAEEEETERGDENDGFYYRKNLENDTVYDIQLKIDTFSFEEGRESPWAELLAHHLL